MMTRSGNEVWVRPETSRVESLGLGDGLVLVKATEVTELTPLPSRVPHHLGEHCLGALSAKSNPFMSL